MGTIYIDHTYFCSSFEEAHEISNVFSTFKFKFVSLGVKRTIRPKRFIRKRKGREGRSHVLQLRYQLDFVGEFCDYGYLDKRTLSKYPELPKEMLGVDKWERWELLRDLDDWNGIWEVEYYMDFQSYFNRELRNLLDKLHLTESIALPHAYSGGYYLVQYEECGQAYQMSYGAEHSTLGVLYKLKDNLTLEHLDMQNTWNWISSYRKYQKDVWKSEIRPLTAFSYAINREPFEQFFYAILGLESVYTNGNRKGAIKRQLKDILPKVIPSVTADDVEELYELRSDFVHGNIEFPNFYDRERGWNQEIRYIKHAEQAAFLLLRTIQLLVKNDAYMVRNDGAGGVVFVR